MASRYAFYVNDPTLTSEQLKAALQSRYPGYRVSLRRVFVNVIAPAKDGFVIRIDKSIFTRVEVTLHTDHIVTVLPVTGQLGCLIGWARFLFLSPKLAVEVRNYLNATFGETNHLVCPRCQKRYAHFYTGCPKCGISFQQPQALSGGLASQTVQIPGRAQLPNNVPTKFCGSCGFENLADSEFCYKCGCSLLTGLLPDAQNQPSV
jgi:hypothetical protein